MRGKRLRLAFVILLTLPLVGCGQGGDARPRSDPAGATATSGSPAASPTPSPTVAGPSASPSPPPAPRPAAAALPQGGRTIFPQYRVVAYYGTANTPVLGVLGESSPDGILSRLRATAARFATPDRKIQVAYELIATVVQASPGADGNYSKTIDMASIQRYVESARRHKVLVVLDVQPGRADFLTEVKKLGRFLQQPHVGLALDPEWRMSAGQVPGKTIGHVSAAEVNAVSAYLAGIVRDRNLPEKLFILHQFRASMIPDIAAVQRRPGLAMVQHLDGFGTRAEKDATFHRLHRPRQFHIGYKLFYDEDVNLYAPADVLHMRPTPEYISYQ